MQGPDETELMHPTWPVHPGTRALATDTLPPPVDAFTARYRHGLILGVLVLLTLVPRAIMAWKIDTLCPDAVVYVGIAERLEQGDLRTAMVQMKLNLFPMALFLLRRLGLDWQVAGELWNITMSTLAVLPLVGWIRRQFSDRVAYVAGFLYATHSRLIERSPEVIRDPTFWFLFLLTVYLLYRAFAETRLTRFAAAGIALWMAVLTRFEGLFLIALALGWCAVQLRAHPDRRWRLAGGALLTIGLVPGLAAAVLPWSAPQMRSVDLVRIEPLERAQLWLDSWSAAPTGAEITPPNESAAQTGEMISMYFDKTLHGIELRSCLLLVAGALATWRTIRRGEYLPLYFLMGLFLLASWIHLWYSGAISSRYVVSVFLLAVPWSAMGLIALASRGADLLAHRGPRARLVLVASILVVVATIGYSDALSSPFKSRRELAAIGDWIRTNLGEGAVVQADPERAALINFYANTKCLDLKQPQTSVEQDSLRHIPSSVVVLDANQGDLAALFAGNFKRLEQVSSDRFDCGDSSLKQRFIVLVRDPLPVPPLLMSKKPAKARGL